MAESASDLIQGGPPPAAAEEEQEFIGVPNDFVARRQVVPTGTGPGLERPFVPQAPQYRRGDDVRIYTDLPVEQRRQIQDALVVTNLIGKNTKVKDGGLDNSTRAAFAELLSIANREGLTWEDALISAMANPMASAGGDGDPTFIAEPFLPDDPEKTRQTIRKAISQITGRPEDQVSDDEVEAMVDTALDLTEQQHEAGQEVARADFDRRVASSKGLGSAPGPDLESGVDAAAQFTETLRERYAPEIQRGKRVKAGAVGGELLMQSILTGDSLIGGQ